jgi:hypothetical protein
MAVNVAKGTEGFGSGRLDFGRVKLLKEWMW